MTESSDSEVFSSHFSSDEFSADEIPQQTNNTNKSAANKRTLATALSQVLKEDTADQPILHARTLKRFKEEEERIVEQKAKRLYKQEQRQKLQALRIKPSAETANAEKVLKKLATAGVVQLFNAVYQAQLKKEQQQPSSKKSKQQAAKAEATSETTSKMDFMDLIKSGTTRVL